MRQLFAFKITRSPVEIETRNRILLSVAAFAYEFLDRPIMTDAQFDMIAYGINKTANTNRPDLDKWFAKNFEPDTGVWIRSHPELARIEQLYYQHYSDRRAVK